MSPPGVDLSLKQLVDALTYKTKRYKDTLLKFSESELDSLERKLQIVASAIRGRRNSLQAVNQLPTEILSMIFHNVQLNLTSFLPDDTDYSDHGRDWQCLLHVCRHWRGIIARCPGMWRVVDNTNVSDVYLRRSQSTPLTVYLGIKKPDFQNNVLDLLHPHLPRIREFHMAADGFGVDATTTTAGSTLYSCPLLTSPAPSLQSLSIGTYGKDPAVAGGVLPQLFHSQTPRLTQLDLEYFTSWPSNHFHNLTHICLSYQDESTRPTTSTFLDFLEASSQTLEELALVRAGPTLDDSDDVPPSPNRAKVHLPKLREMNLGEWPTPSPLGRFLSTLIIPSTTDLYIWGSVLSDPFADLSSVIPIDTSDLGNFQNIKRWFLTHFFASQVGELLYTPFLAVVGGGSESGPALHTYGPFQPSRLLETLPRFPLQDVKTFVVRDSSLQTNRFSTSAWKEILDKMDKLEELRILAFQSVGTTRGVLGALMPKGTEGSGVGDGDENQDQSQSQDQCQNHLVPPSNHIRGSTPTTKSPSMKSSSSSAPITPICPKLRYLTIEHDADLASIFIAKLVRARRRAGSCLEKLKVLVLDPRGPGGRRSSVDSDGSSLSPPPLPHTNPPTTSNHLQIYTHPPPPAPPPTDDDSETEHEYRVRSDESYELLRSCLDSEDYPGYNRSKWEVEFVHGTPLSRDLVPSGWPTNVWIRTGGAAG
ncbi:hypothetical protein E1B28_009883 [Marasmius oreades]|uniref:F-box domain-containing protein n=1 Tax=Marasmius oreades TaxID=181124 RepID=A0A9P7UT35_9AGAR|nr:uncharacterized protein E1B28_009883 [Marasmius oreades]KAG7090799.1 hypothetical protein E1B28_009883 [Marasmius oreades]